MCAMGTVMALFDDLPVFFPAVLFAIAIAMSELLTFRYLLLNAKERTDLSDRVNKIEGKNYILKKRLKELRS